jgi:hypothetical protein
MQIFCLTQIYIRSLEEIHLKNDIERVNLNRFANF